MRRRHAQANRSSFRSLALSWSNFSITSGLPHASHCASVMLAPPHERIARRQESVTALAGQAHAAQPNSPVRPKASQRLEKGHQRLDLVLRQLQRAHVAVEVRIVNAALVVELDHLLER